MVQEIEAFAFLPLEGAFSDFQWYSLTIDSDESKYPMVICQISPK